MSSMELGPLEWNPQQNQNLQPSTSSLKPDLHIIQGGLSEDAATKRASDLKNLLGLHSPEKFDSIGGALKAKLKAGTMQREALQTDLHTASSELSDEEVQKVVEGFIGTGYVGYTRDGKLQLTQRGKESQLGHDVLQSAVIARELLQNPPTKKRHMASMGDIDSTYQLTRETNKVHDVEVTVDKPSGNVMYLSEILLGNNASDTQFLGKVIREIHTLPPEMKPDAVVVSGLMQGTFKYRNKERRASLVPELRSLDRQFQAAKVVMDDLKNTGADIIYSMSNDDREIAREGTMEAMRVIQHHGKQSRDRSKGHISYWQEDQLRQQEAWDSVYQFQLDVVLPYCLRSGRRLRSADEVAEMTGGRVRMEEFFMLYDAYNAGVAGREIPQSYQDILTVENIPFPGKEFEDFTFVDDVNLSMTANGKNGEKHTATQMIRHNLKLTDVSLPQNPIDAAHAAVRQMNSEGLTVPQGLVVVGQQQLLGIGGAEGKWTMATGGFTDGYKALEQRGSIANAGKPPAWRELTGRRILGKPSAEMHEFTEDGRHIVTIFNEKLMDKSDAVPERRTIAQFTDWQTGSTTARPDLQMKFTDMVFSNIMKEQPVYMLMDGDIIHGDIYPSHKNESAHMQLTAPSSQQAFVLAMFERALDHVPPEDLGNLLKVMTAPGNHEWNNGYKDNGAVPNDYLVNFFKNVFKNKGITPEPGRVKGYGAARTGYGDHFKSWSGLEKDIAGYGIVFQHMMMEKGGKGSGNKAPVFQAQTLFEGLGDLAKDVDMGIFGHWHHPQIGLFGNKLAVVGPALAGLSGYEWMRGYRAVLGGTLIHVGGGLPPQVEFVSAKALHEHKIKEGYFSDKNLAQEGFKTDKDFDPVKHGYSQRRSSTTRSALQKALWEMTDDIVFAADSEI